jgi:hypothetical protein
MRSSATLIAVFVALLAIWDSNAAWPCPNIREIGWNDLSLSEYGCQRTSQPCTPVSRSGSPVHGPCPLDPSTHAPVPCAIDFQPPPGPFCPTTCSLFDSHNGRRLSDGDEISVSVERFIVDPSAVEFVAVNNTDSGWWKGVEVPDGQGSSWAIQVDGRFGGGMVPLWAQQVNNGQQLTFQEGEVPRN